MIQSIVRGFLTRRQLLRKSSHKSNSTKKMLQKAEAQTYFVKPHLGSNKKEENVGTSETL